MSSLLFSLGPYLHLHGAKMDDMYPISEQLRRRAVEASVDQKMQDESQLMTWRYHQLIMAGADPHHAQVLAERTDISLHDALDLLENGCPPGTAAAILL